MPILSFIAVPSISTSRAVFLTSLSPRVVLPSAALRLLPKTAPTVAFAAIPPSLPDEVESREARSDNPTFVLFKVVEFIRVVPFLILISVPFVSISKSLFLISTSDNTVPLFCLRLVPATAPTVAPSS